jgi:ABC-type sugar transport system permease subunit
MPYEKRKGMYGYGFIALWLLGTIKWFLIPLFASLRNSFGDIELNTGSMDYTWIGLDNYKYAFMEDSYYVQYLVSVLKNTAIKTPLIIVFSLFVAVILNQEFKGRGFARAVFFLPVIVATGPVYAIISGDMSSSGSNDASQFSTMFETDLVGELMEFIGIYGISDALTETIQSITTDIFSLVWNSGIQILIFLAGLQNIPTSAREAAQMEGATAWEYFWKITFPYVSPMILANLIFTIIDSFTDTSNSVMKLVLEYQKNWEFGRSSAMAWSYFLIVMVAVGIITAIVNKFVYYEVD